MPTLLCARRADMGGLCCDPNCWNHQRGFLGSYKEWLNLSSHGPPVREITQQAKTSFSAGLMSWSRSYEPQNQHKEGNGNFSQEREWEQGQAGMGGGRAFHAFGRSSSTMMCHFTLCCVVGVENSPAKIKQAVVWVDFSVHEPGSAPEHSSTTSYTGQSKGGDFGMGEAKRGSEMARGDTELKGKGVEVLSLTQSVVTSAMWCRPLSCCSSGHPAAPRCTQGRTWLLSEPAGSDPSVPLPQELHCSSPTGHCPGAAARPPCLTGPPCRCPGKANGADVRWAANPASVSSANRGGLLFHLPWQLLWPEPELLTHTERDWPLGSLVASPAAS